MKHPPVPALDFAAAVKQVLDEEAKRNELHIGAVRAIGFVAILGIDVLTAAMGLRPPENVAQSLVFAIVALAMLLALRRAPFQGWYKYAIPVADMLLLAGILGPRLEQLGAGHGLVATAALVCGLFSASGALRFARRSSIWTTLLAGLLLVWLIGPYAETHEVMYTATALASIGLLAMWLADLVRRSMEGAGSQVVLARFLPPELVAQAFSNPMAAMAEPRVHDATVLVSDLRGFTALAERTPPDRVFAFLSELQGELARVVHAHGGVVDKFLGDGMLAIFGAAGETEGHAARAVAAARDIRVVVGRLNDQGHLDEPLRVGIGIHSGPLVAGVIGNDDRMEWTVIGDTVNTASRLEALTKDKAVDVLLTDEVLARAGDVGATALGRVQVRGREQSLGIWALDAARTPTAAEPAA